MTVGADPLLQTLCQQSNLAQMPASNIRFDGVTAHLHKAACSPGFGQRTILVKDAWDYVELWLRRNCENSTALFYWKQAKAFANATALLDKLSAPLTAYYSVLNATKALLTAKRIAFSDQHGVSGSPIGIRTSLSSVNVDVKGAGVLSSLLDYYSLANLKGSNYDLKKILANLPFVHRAFCSTFTSIRELFIPISKPRFVVMDGSTEAWFCCDIRDTRMQTRHAVRAACGFEHDNGIKDTFTIRKKQRFKWDPSNDFEASYSRLLEKHRQIRVSISYVAGLTRLWYLKRSTPKDLIIECMTMPLMFMALHRLSEFARYSPATLDALFSTNSNWLISEFLSSVLPQYIDECSSEITGQEFMPPGIHL